MKVPQDRLNQQEPYYPHHAAQNMQGANAPQNDERYSAPSNADMNNSPNPQNPQSPLEAKRRVQPNLAKPEEAPPQYSDQSYHDSAPPYPQENAYGRGPHNSDNSDPYQEDYPPQPPEAHGPYEQNAAQPAGQIRREEARQHGPYQAVVVFLLLLMALVILGIVYQLFFRPSPDHLPIARAGQVVEQNYTGAANQNDATANGLNTNNSSTAQAETQNTTSQQGQLGGSSVLSSPLSNVTPSGEVLSPQASQGKQAGQNSQSKQAQQQISQKSQNSQARQNSRGASPTTPANYGNQDLPQSKVGGIGYWIQVGAFSSFGNASSVQQELKRHHIESVVQESTGTRKFYRVRVGLYTSQEEAERILRQLHNIGRPFRASIIIKIKI